jgi:hypothetical protein
MSSILEMAVIPLPHPIMTANANSQSLNLKISRAVMNSLPLGFTTLLAALNAFSLRIRAKSIAD